MDTTYRSDLRELNELNFARFDAKLEQRLSHVEARLESRIDRVEARFEVALHELKADLLKWMFRAWATLLAAMIALIKLG